MANDELLPLLKNGTNNLIIYYSKGAPPTAPSNIISNNNNNDKIPSYDNYYDESIDNDMTTTTTARTTTQQLRTRPRLSSTLLPNNRIITVTRSKMWPPPPTTTSRFLLPFATSSPSSVVNNRLIAATGIVAASLTTTRNNLSTQQQQISSSSDNVYTFGDSTDDFGEGLTGWIRYCYYSYVVNMTLKNSMVIPIAGAGVLLIIIAMLAISLAVHLRYARKRTIRQIISSRKSLWFKSPGQGEVQLNNYHYMYSQSTSMAMGSDRPDQERRYQYWAVNKDRRHNPKEVDFFKQRPSLIMPGDVHNITGRFPPGQTKQEGEHDPDALLDSLLLAHSPSRLVMRKGDKMRRSLSGFELVMPHCLGGPILNDRHGGDSGDKSCKHCDISGNNDDRRQSGSSQKSHESLQSQEMQLDDQMVEELTRQHLRNMLSAFQWRTKSAEDPCDLNRLVEEYADRCYREGAYSFLPRQHSTGSAGGGGGGSMRQSSSPHQQRRVTFKPGPVAASPYHHIPSSFSTASAIRQYRTVSSLVPLTMPVSSSQLMASSGSIGSKSAQQQQPPPSPSCAMSLWAGIKDFFSPLHARPSRNRQTFRRGGDSDPTSSSSPRVHQLVEGGDSSGRMTGGTSAMLMFGKAHDIYI